MAIVRVFLKDVGKIPGFVSKSKPDGPTDYRVKDAPDIILRPDGGSLYLEMSSLHTPIPKILEKHITHIIFEELLHPDFPERTFGIYSKTYGEEGLRSIEAELQTVGAPGGKSGRRLRIIGERLEDIQRLLTDFKSGEVAPSRVYRTEQVEISQENFEKELEKVRNDLRLIHGDMERLKMGFNGTLKELNGYCRHLLRDGWPLCNKFTVGGELSRILRDINDHISSIEEDGGQSPEPSAVVAALNSMLNGIHAVQNDAGEMSDGAKKALTATTSGEEDKSSPSDPEGMYEPATEEEFKNETGNKRLSLTEIVKVKLATLQAKWQDWLKGKRKKKGGSKGTGTKLPRKTPPLKKRGAE